MFSTMPAICSEAAVVFLCICNVSENLYRTLNTNYGDAPESDSPPWGEGSRCRSKSSIGTLKSKQRIMPLFQLILEAGHEMIGDGAVDQPVVKGKRQIGDGTDGDRVVDDNGSL